MIPTHLANRLRSVKKRIYFVSYGVSGLPQDQWPMDILAKYPLGIVSSNLPDHTTNKCTEFRRACRAANPDIVLLGYSNLLNESQGWRRVYSWPKAQLEDFHWATAADGAIVGNKWGRYYDPRHPEVIKAMVR